MIINNKFIYIHIPKTGGSSVHESLGVPQGGTEGHMSIKEIRDTITPEKHKLPVICFVRNPYDRLVSAYHFCYGDEKVTYPGVTFDRRYSLSYPIPRPPSPDTFARFIGVSSNLNNISLSENLHLFKTQFSFVSIGNKLSAGYIYRFENLKTDFDKMKKRFSLKGELPHINKGTKRAPWQEFYRDKKVKEKVDELYRIDFEEFGYPMEIK
jgi:hypothetical protein